MFRLVKIVEKAACKMLMKLPQVTEKVTFSRSISPVCLPEFPSDEIDKYKNYQVDLTGWGQNHLHGRISDRLKRVSLKIFPLRYTLLVITRKVNYKVFF
jgi:hypothetical protein